MIKIAIISHKKLLRTVVKTLLQPQSDMTVVADMDIDENTVQQLDKLQPKVTIFMNHSTHKPCVHIIQQIIRTVPATRLLVLSAERTSPYPTRLLRAGAAGYLTQYQSPEKLVHAIHCVAAGQSYLSPEVAVQLTMSHLDKNQSYPFDKFSDRELEIAYQLASGASIQTIANNLYLAPGTISCYRYKLLKRLNIDNTVDLTRIAAEHQLIDPLCISIVNEEGDSAYEDNEGSHY